MRKLVTTSLIGVAGLIYATQPIDFEKINHWTGEGNNRAAIAVRFGENNKTFVWGYKWEDRERPTGEDMMKAICGNSDKLVILTQYTGQYGATLCGAGYGDADELLDRIRFDFDMARDYEWINFDYYQTNPLFGQNEAPGDNTPQICQAAIDAAKTTHVIQHPIDYRNYGYPAYDYDCWKLYGNETESLIWESGWYAGYWSYWLGSESGSDWVYSGTGFSGRFLKDGAIDAWTYTVFDKPGIGGFGEGTPPSDTPDDIVYVQEKTSVGTREIISVPAKNPEYYTLSGMKLPGEPAEPGFYIRKQGNKTIKILIN